MVWSGLQVCSMAYQSPHGLCAPRAHTHLSSSSEHCLTNIGTRLLMCCGHQAAENTKKTSDRLNIRHVLHGLTTSHSKVTLRL